MYQRQFPHAQVDSPQQPSAAPPKPSAQGKAEEAQPSKLRVRVSDTDVGVSTATVRLSLLKGRAAPDVIKVEHAYNTTAATLWSLVGTSWTVATDCLSGGDLPKTFTVTGLDSGYEVQVRVFAGTKVPDTGEVTWGPASEVATFTTLTEAALKAREESRSAKLQESQQAARRKSAALKARAEADRQVAQRAPSSKPHAAAGEGTAPREEVASLEPGRVSDIINKFGGGRVAREAQAAQAPEADHAGDAEAFKAVVQQLKEELQAAQDKIQSMSEDLQASSGAAVEGRRALEGFAAHKHMLTMQLEALQKPGPAPELEAALVKDGHDRGTVRFVLDVLTTDEAAARRVLDAVQTLEGAGLPKAGVKEAVAVFFARKSHGQSVAPESAVGDAGQDAAAAAVGEAAGEDESAQLLAFAKAWVAAYHSD